MSSIGKRWFAIVLSKVKTFFISKNVLTFLVFLLLSTIFWFVHTLDRERQSIIKLEINYTGIPEDIEIKNQLPRQIDVTIRDEGMKLLHYSREKLDPITIDMARVYFSKGKIIITPDQLKAKISDYVLPTTAVLKITPDSISVNYQKLATKELPVKIGGKVSLAKQYIYSDSLRIDPSKVKVFGPEYILDTMKAVYTEEVDLKNVADTTILKSKLRVPKDVKFSFYDVNIGIFVEMFTENRIEIPITIINAPNNLNVRVFPVSVSATYNVGLSNYTKVNVNNIKVVFDYKEIENRLSRKSRLQILNNSLYISNLRIDPDEVEFLLENK